jgi:hypothetical protein
VNDVGTEDIGFFFYFPVRIFGGCVCVVFDTTQQRQLKDDDNCVASKSSPPVSWITTTNITMGCISCATVRHEVVVYQGTIRCDSDPVSSGGVNGCETNHRYYCKSDRR